MRSRENKTMRRFVHAADPHLRSVYHPSIDAISIFLDSVREHVRSIRAVIRFRQPECETDFAV